MTFLYRWGPVIIWMGVIYTGSANPDPFLVVPVSVTVPHEKIGQVAHVLEYAVLAILFGRGILDGGKIDSKSAIQIVFFSFSHGLFDEIHQSWIPERAFQLFDLGLDVIGSMIGVGYCRWCSRKESTKGKK